MHTQESPPEKLNYLRNKTKILIKIPEDFFDVTGERALWRAVITQALMDASNMSKKREDKILKARALAWLASKGDDFTTVCDLADIDVDYAKKMIKEALARNCKWRKDKKHKHDFDTSNILSLFDYELNSKPGHKKILDMIYDKS